MTGPVGNRPQGYLSLLSLKNLGQSPRDGVDTYQPTIEMLQWLCQTDAVFIAGVSTPITDNTVGMITYPELLVPSNELWYVLHFHVDFTCPATNTDQAAFAPAILLDPAPGPAVQVYTVGDCFAPPSNFAGAGPTQPCAHARDFFAPPGSQLGVWTMSVATAGAGLTTTGRVRVCRMRV